jgi:hypothetical protein
MLIIQILLLVFFLIAIIKVVGRYRSRELSLRAVAMWVFFWLAAGVAVIHPNSTAYFAKLVGIGRGADLVVYCSIALIFFIIFRLMIKIDRLDRQITLLVRRDALGDVEKNKK